MAIQSLTLAQCGTQNHCDGMCKRSSASMINQAFWLSLEPPLVLAPFNSAERPFGPSWLTFGVLWFHLVHLGLLVLTFGISWYRFLVIVLKLFWNSYEKWIFQHPILQNTCRLSERTFTEATHCFSAQQHRPLAQSGNLPWAIPIRSGPVGARGVFGFGRFLLYLVLSPK